MENSSATFQCVVIAPSGKLLDCASDSVIIPAHDGQRGILRNHMPMFCALGLGIMEIKNVSSELNALQKPLFLMVNGGFALFASNLLKVVAYDAVSIDGLSGEQIEHIRQKEQKRLTHKGISKAEYNKELARSKVLESLIELQKAV
jgi:F-type H+-transporting ATPase subunit epsilon